MAWLLAAILVAVMACSSRHEVGGRSIRFVTWKPDQPPVWDEAIRRFEQAHPDIRVRREVGPHASNAFHDLVTQKLKNRDADLDVYFMDVVWLAEFAAAGWAEPLDRWLGPAQRAEFLEGAVHASTWRGRVFGIPAFVDAGLLYYRKDLLDKYHLPVPTTWPELEAEAHAVLRAEAAGPQDLYGYSGQFMQYEGLVCDLLEFIAGNGGQLVDDEARRATLDDPKTLEAIRWVRDHVIGALAPRSVLTYQEPESLALFLQGHALFLRNWPYAWQVVNDPAKSRVAGRVGIASLPHFPGGESSSALGGWLYGISSFSRHPEAAWAFVEFMTSAEMQTYFAREASLAPTRTALYQDRDVLERNPEFARQADAFRSAVPRPVTPMYPAVSAALQRFLSTAIASRGGDIERIARSAGAEIDGYLELGR
jgi:trehalose/maltose transport system substrate-binding protein